MGVFVTVAVAVALAVLLIVPVGILLVWAGFAIHRIRVHIRARRIYGRKGKNRR